MERTVQATIFEVFAGHQIGCELKANSDWLEGQRAPRQLSYDELSFHLEDSASFRAFAGLPLAWSPKKSVLHRTISAIRPQA